MSPIVEAEGGVSGSDSTGRITLSMLASGVRDVLSCAADVLSRPSSDGELRGLADDLARELRDVYDAYVVASGADPTRPPHPAS